MTLKRKATPVVGLTAAALLLTACAASERDTDTDAGADTIVGQRREELVQVLVRFLCTCECGWQRCFREMRGENVGAR